MSPDLLLCQRFFAEKVNLLCHFGLSCSAGIVPKFPHRPVCPKAGPRGWIFLPIFSTVLFCGRVSRWSCDPWKVSPFTKLCVLRNRIYMLLCLCPKNPAGKEFGWLQLHSYVVWLEGTSQMCRRSCFPGAFLAIRKQAGRGDGKCFGKNPLGFKDRFLFSTVCL